MRSVTYLSLLSLCCPALAFGLVLAARAGWLYVHNDFSGMQGVGFILGSIMLLLGAGALSGWLAVGRDRASWLARIAAALNTLLLLGSALVLVELAF